MNNDVLDKNVMKTQNTLSIITSFFENLLFSGIVLGWPSLQYVLLQENYFASFCPNNSMKSSQNASDHYEMFYGNNTKILFCPERDSIINLALALAFSTQYFVSYFSGVVLDKCGTWIFRLFAFGGIFIAYLLLALSSPEKSWLVLLAMALLCTGGLMIGTSNIQLAFLAKSIKGMIINIQSGTFSSAAIVFLLVKDLHNLGISIFSIFVGLAMLSSLTCIRTFTLMPKGILTANSNPQKLKYGWNEWTCIQSTSSEKKLSENNTKDGIEHNSVDSIMSLEKKDLNRNPRTSSDNNLFPSQSKSSSFRQSCTSLLFWSNAFTFSVGHLRQIFFIGSFVNWIQSFAEYNMESLIDFFNICFLATVIGSFSIGILYDSVTKFYKKRLSNVKVINLKASCSIMLTNSCLLTLISVFVLFHQTRLSVVLIVLSQSFVYGGNWTFLGVNFPSEHYGKLLGLTQVFGGISSLISYGLFRLAIYYDPQFTYVNTALLVLSIFTFCHPCIVYKKSCSCSN